MPFRRRPSRSSLHVAQVPCAVRASVAAGYGPAPSRDATHIPGRGATDVSPSHATRGATRSDPSNQYDTRALHALAAAENDLDEDDRAGLSVCSDGWAAVLE